MDILSSICAFEFVVRNNGCTENGYSNWYRKYCGIFQCE